MITERLRFFTKRHLFLALLALHILPIWCFRYFPSQDGMNHIYNAYLLKEYHNPALYKTREIFQLNLTLFPNWMSHLIMAGLMFIVPPLIAEKLLLTLIIALVPCAFFYFLRSINRESECFAWLGFLFTYNYLLHMGFYNFALSFGLFFLVIGYWWRYRNDMTSPRIALLYLMLVLLYLCHIASYALALMVIGLAAIWTFRRMQPILVCAGYMLPAGFILLGYLLKDTQGLPARYVSGKWLWEYFWKNRALISFNDDFVWANLILHGWVALAILWTFWSDKIARRKPIEEKDIFLLISLICLLLFLKLPREIGPGGWINERVHIFFLPMLLPWLTTRFSRPIKHVAVGCMITLSLIHLGYTSRDLAVYNRDMAKFVGVFELPDHAVYRRLDSDNWGPLAKYAMPYFNGFVTFGFRGDRPYIYNYEAQFDYFPINFKGKNWRDTYEGDVIPYRIGWNVAEDSPKLKPFLKDYEVIFSTESLKVLRHKLFATAKTREWDELAKADNPVRFVMGAEGQQTEGDEHLVTPTRRYRPGSYGWDTLSPREAFEDGVRDSEDAAFRIDVPNGKYRVRCRFRSGDDQPLRMEMYINGKRAAKPFVASSDGEIEQHFQAVVSDGTLILVLHSRDRGKNRRWVWRDCTIEKR